MYVRYWALWVLPLELNKLLIIVAKPTEVANFDALVILGFGQMSQVLANFLHLVNLDSQVPILYGDGSRAALLESAGISSPKAVMVMYEGRQRAVKAVERIRLAFPAILRKPRQYAILENAEFATRIVKASEGLGIMSDDVSIN
ncbi:K(+) efflux antiporter 3, chloroplastic [Tanacetum coccineum]|uniref:K(+) efflux antiporter 3, chloroplastic n=1 Tax=Tanacetum coccineum TaxID=301880 RepID=A0ABQ5I885_9ASTR